MSEQTNFTVVGEDILSLKITSDHTRFKDPKITTSAELDPKQDIKDSIIDLTVNFRGGYREAASARVITDADEGSLYISEFEITKSPRSKGVPQFLTGAIYGLALWAEKEGIYGLIDHSKLKKELLLNAGFPPNNFIMSDSAMYFYGDLDQIDYERDDFTVVRE